MAKEKDNLTPKILVADDDPSIVGLIKETLTPEGFEVSAAENGEQVVRMIDHDEYDLIILDVMMPEMDGFEACSLIRQKSEVPIVFLSAKDEEADKVVGLTLGADDYVTKPFKPRELVARVKARLRRKLSASTASSTRQAMGIEIDKKHHEARLLNERLDLTPKEFDMIALLVSNAGCPVSAKELFENIWHEEYRTCDANTVMVHIRRLRRKLEEIDSSQCYIETVFGVGYKIPCAKDGD